MRARAPSVWRSVRTRCLADVRGAQNLPEPPAGSSDAEVRGTYNVTMGFGTAIDLRRFARPGASVIAETSAGLTVRLTFGGVARASATAAVRPGLVHAGDELSVCLGPQTVRLAAAFEVVTIDGGNQVDTVTLVVRQGAVVAGAAPKQVERAVDATVVQSRPDRPDRQLPCRVVEAGGGEVTVHVQARLTGGEEIALVAPSPDGTVGLQLHVLRAVSAPFDGPSYRCRPGRDGRGGACAHLPLALAAVGAR
jgi:hypothetical protein